MESLIKYALILQHLCYGTVIVFKIMKAYSRHTQEILLTSRKLFQNSVDTETHCLLNLYQTSRRADLLNLIFDELMVTSTSHTCASLLIIMSDFINYVV